EGRGIGLLFVALAVLPIGASVAGWFYRPMRNVEVDLPDAVSDDEDEDEDAAAATAAASEATTTGGEAPAEA
ncbi:MAG TPA: hypothetical protein VF150_12180, partial [Thermoanaerobaculia bacterium]